MLTYLLLPRKLCKLAATNSSWFKPVSLEQIFQNIMHRRSHSWETRAKGESWLRGCELAVGTTQKGPFPCVAAALTYSSHCFISKTGTKRVSSNLELYLPCLTVKQDT